MERKRKSYIILTEGYEKDFPKQIGKEDVRTKESLLRYLYKEFTKEGDKIIDIFAGFGTMLTVAEQINRIPFGIELRKNFYDYIRSNLKLKENIIHGDAGKLSSFNLPMMDFAITSPPFMCKTDSEYALSSYSSEGTYEQYLVELKKIFYSLRNIMKPDAYVVLLLSNIRRKRDGITTLAWDVGKLASEVFYFVDEIIVIDESEDESEYLGFDHSYCLIFRNQ
ncbi:MAG: DNA methyltransferase [Promethearchaeota archaeon]